MDHLVLRHPSYMRGFTYPFSLSVINILPLSAIFYSQRLNFVIFPRQVALQNPNGYVKIVTNFDIKIGHIINF
jgi:hypothetical protein